MLVTASTVGPADTLDALNDGVVRNKSNELKVPRFTWGENKGTGQWVQYSFSGPRRLSFAEVLWHDDSGTGACRMPRQWRLLYKDGNAWKDVPNPSGYGTAPDKMNRVTFDPITTDQIRLFAELRPDRSARILEWRVGN